MRTRIISLPEPNNAEREHAARVAERVTAAITDTGGCLPFDRFMDIALHAPGLGYYAGGRTKFGAQGDFVTAPELGPLFGRCLARQCAEVLDAIDAGSIIEFGAGSGALCCQVLTELDALDALPERYWILETSSELKHRQGEMVAQLREDIARRVGWLTHLPETPFTGVVIANEVLDAMPITRFEVSEQGVSALGVACNGEGFSWCALDESPMQGPIGEIVKRHQLPPGYRSEYNPRAMAWVGQLAEWVDEGIIFIIDYGYPAAEFYHPQRRNGTMTCFFRHTAHDNPLLLTGIQDITAHLDFTALARSARCNGLDVVGYTAQASFLFGAGLMDVIGKAPSTPQAQLALANEVKRLTLPTEMGELCKVLALGRGLRRAPGAFVGCDRSSMLDA
jgi:SAM-dependent MidA family methyltransferase